jgi:apolipoprotein N-acyltransferase
MTRQAGLAAAPAGRRAPTPGVPSRALGLLALAGVVTGAGHWFAPAAWLGLGLLAFALRAPLPTRWLACGLAAHGLALLFVGHPWVMDAISHYLPGGMATTRLAIAPLALLWLAPLALALGVGARLAWRFHLPVWAWLPLAWVAGEAAFEGLGGIDFNAWLYTQHAAVPVLRAVGHLGWWPALGLCVGLSAAIAETCRTRSWRPGVVAAAGLAVLGLLPPLPAVGPAAFDGIGAVHMPDEHTPPRSAPAGVRVLMWPELADTQSPRLREGANPGAYIEPPFRADGLHHVYGLKTRDGVGIQNALVALGPEGQVHGVRAKTRLFPLTERPIAGYQPAGQHRFTAGAGLPVLDVGGRRFGTLICLETGDRAIARAAKAAGATMLVMAAKERGGEGSPMALEQLLAISVLRTVEAGLPMVRASQVGHAAMIDRDGRVLARSRPGTSGVLTVTGDAATSVPTGVPSAAPPGGLAVLYARATPAMQPMMPAGIGARHAIEDFGRPAAPAETVILSGDSLPPHYLGRSAEEVARAIIAFHPTLIVLDTCYGASTPLLDALAATGSTAWVVAPAYRIPVEGLRFQPDFFTEPDAARRALAVRMAPSAPLLRWRLDRAALKRVHASVEAMSPQERRRLTKRTRPRLIQAQLPGRPAPDGRLLVPAPR